MTSSIRRAWAWLWQGNLCRRCRVERTYLHFVEDICTTCAVVEIIKWRSQ